MTEQILKDKRGYPIGKITTDKEGVQTIKDVRGTPKGTYNPKTNKTKDRRGYEIGTGNLLITLLEV